MPFIIPNATDTTSGNKYAVLDQAEPDSIDFEILGNDTTGVISGCEVTPPVSGGTGAVSVASGGVVVLNGVVYTVEANSYLNVPVNPSNSGEARFDLIVARLVSGSMVLTCLYGAASTSNPALPKSSSRLTSTTGVDVLSYFNPSTDVPLAAVYRANGITSILSEHIVDKRRSIQTPIAYRGSTVPTSSQGGVGDLYLRTSTLANGESGVYVKRDSSTWQQLAGVPLDPGVPIGTVITWVSPSAPNGSVWVECNGAAVARSGTYASLYSVLTASGTVFPYGEGNGSTTFNLPDFRGYYLSGLPTAGGALGSAAGNTNNEVTLSLSQTPEHTHSINHGHTGTAALGGAHTHTPGTTNVNFATQLTTYPDFGYVAPVDATDPKGVADDYGYLSQPAGGMSLSYTSTTAESSTHTHSVDIPTSTGLTSGTAGQSSPSPVNIQPRTMYVKYYIRYA